MCRRKLTQPSTQTEGERGTVRQWLYLVTTTKLSERPQSPLFNQHITFFQGRPRSWCLTRRRRRWTWRRTTSSRRPSAWPSPSAPSSPSHTASRPSSTAQRYSSWYGLQGHPHVQWIFLTTRMRMLGGCSTYLVAHSAYLRFCILSKFAILSKI